MDNAQRDELVQLLQKTELAIATLYETFASKIPSSKETWMSFAREERDHANWIDSLYKHFKDEKISPQQTT